MAKRVKVPAITAEERERNRRLADEAQRERAAAAAALATVKARAYLAEQGLLIDGEGVGKGLARLDRWRKARGYGVGLGVQASAPSYRPTIAQQQARELPGIYREVEF